MGALALRMDVLERCALLQQRRSREAAQILTKVWELVGLGEVSVLVDETSVRGSAEPVILSSSSGSSPYNFPCYDYDSDSDDDDDISSSTV
jgi:hypothetical protein